MAGEGAGVVEQGLLSGRIAAVAGEVELHCRCVANAVLRAAISFDSGTCYPGSEEVVLAAMVRRSVWR